MKKYVVLRAVVISGTTHQIGDVVELERYEAASLLGAGQIGEYVKPKKTVDRSVGLKKSTATKVKKRAKKKK
jgi:hypothetical protein